MSVVWKIAPGERRVKCWPIPGALRNEECDHFNCANRRT